MEIFDLIKLYNIKSVAHITGGGFKDNIRRVIPYDKYDIELYKWELPNIFKWIQYESGLSYDRMREIYNCGYGMVIITKDHINSDSDLDLIGKIILR